MVWAELRACVSCWLCCWQWTLGASPKQTSKETKAGTKQLQSRFPFVSRLYCMPPSLLGLLLGQTGPFHFSIFLTGAQHWKIVWAWAKPYRYRRPRLRLNDILDKSLVHFAYLNTCEWYFWVQQKDRENTSFRRRVRRRCWQDINAKEGPRKPQGSGPILPCSVQRTSELIQAQVLGETTSRRD